MIDPSLTPERSLRELKRDVVRARIADAAIDLFAEHGFERVTVDQIAAAVGISSRSFNRYFPTKEDAVMGDAPLWGEFVREAFAERPRDETVWASLHAAYDLMIAAFETDQARQKLTMRVLITAPTLRARNLEKHFAWARMLAPLAAERLTGDDAEVRAEAIVQASLACFDVALVTWAQPDETRSPRTLLRITFDAAIFAS
ncbi:TetR/AcrR family transcriptional regulator [Nesterenkonia sp. CF4.4]|uniref:TetR/AcrR family transcriptional regulator n=1 Tax=Nesterenkonia sp. CF4.4 TaxID=3373079 RepID=UPI003EE59720